VVAGEVARLVVVHLLPWDGHPQLEGVGQAGGLGEGTLEVGEGPEDGAVHGPADDVVLVPLPGVVVGGGGLGDHVPPLVRGKGVGL